MMPAGMGTPGLETAQQTQYGLQSAPGQSPPAGVRPRYNKGVETKYRKSKEKKTKKEKNLTIPTETDNIIWEYTPDEEYKA